MHLQTHPLLALTTLITSASAHGYVRTWTLNNAAFPGYSNTDRNTAPPTIGWSYTTPDEGPELDITSPDFICRQGGSPASAYGTVAAGSTASFFWTSDDKATNPNGWDASHKGPIITYIAPCNNGDCTTVDKSTLLWTKIAAVGLMGAGTWATDDMIANNGVTSATIPAGIKAGKYVLRNEIIALHKANVYQPEFYVQCANVEVVGGGNDTLAGVGTMGASLYSASDVELFGFDVYDMVAGKGYRIPGPAMYGGVNGTGVGAVVERVGSGSGSGGVLVGAGSSSGAGVGSGSSGKGSGAGGGILGSSSARGSGPGSGTSGHASSSPSASVVETSSGTSLQEWSDSSIPDMVSEADCSSESEQDECSEEDGQGHETDVGSAIPTVWSGWTNSPTTSASQTVSVAIMTSSPTASSGAAASATYEQWKSWAKSSSTTLSRASTTSSFTTSDSWSAPISTVTSGTKLLAPFEGRESWSATTDPTPSYGTAIASLPASSTALEATTTPPSENGGGWSDWSGWQPRGRKW